MSVASCGFGRVSNNEKNLALDHLNQQDKTNLTKPDAIHCNDEPETQVDKKNQTHYNLFSKTDHVNSIYITGCAINDDSQVKWSILLSLRQKTLIPL